MHSTVRAEARAHLPDPAKPSANRSSRKRLTKTAHLLIARPTRYRSIVRSSMVRCWLSTFLRPTDRGCRETISRDAPISSPLGLARAPTHISLVFVTAYRRQCGHTPSSPKKTVAQGAAPERRRDPPWHAWKRDTPVFLWTTRRWRPLPVRDSILGVQSALLREELFFHRQGRRRRYRIRRCRNRTFRQRFCSPSDRRRIGSGYEAPCIGNADKKSPFRRPLPSRRNVQLRCYSRLAGTRTRISTKVRYRHSLRRCLLVESVL